MTLIRKYKIDDTNKSMLTKVSIILQLNAKKHLYLKSTINRSVFSLNRPLVIARGPIVLPRIHHHINV